MGWAERWACVLSAVLVVLVSDVRGEILRPIYDGDFSLGPASQDLPGVTYPRKMESNEKWLVILGKVARVSDGSEVDGSVAVFSRIQGSELVRFPFDFAPGAFTDDLALHGDRLCLKTGDGSDSEVHCYNLAAGQTDPSMELQVLTHLDVPLAYRPTGNFRLFVNVGLAGNSLLVGSYPVTGGPPTVVMQFDLNAANDFVFTDVIDLGYNIISQTALTAYGDWFIAPGYNYNNQTTYVDRANLYKRNTATNRFEVAAVQPLAKYYQSYESLGLGAVNPAVRLQAPYLTSADPLLFFSSGRSTTSVFETADRGASWVEKDLLAVSGVPLPDQTFRSQMQFSVEGNLLAVSNNQQLFDTPTDVGNFSNIGTVNLYIRAGPGLAAAWEPIGELRAPRPSKGYGKTVAVQGGQVFGGEIYGLSPRVTVTTLPTYITQQISRSNTFSKRVAQLESELAAELGTVSEQKQQISNSVPSDEISQQLDFNSVALYSMGSVTIFIFLVLVAVGTFLAVKYYKESRDASASAGKVDSASVLSAGP